MDRYVIPPILPKVIAASAWVLGVAAVAQPPEQAPIGFAFEPAQLQEETYIWKIVPTASGQVTGCGERLGFYQDNRWEFLAEPRRPMIRDLLVDGDTLWVASYNQIGRISLPLNRGSHYESLPIPSLSQTGDIWFLGKAGDNLVAAGTQELFIIDPRDRSVSSFKLPNPSHLWVLRWEGKVIVNQPETGIWEVADGQLRPLENPLPGGDRSGWIWTDTEFVLTAQGLYRKESDGYRLVRETRTINQEGGITTAIRWEKWIVLCLTRKGLALVDPNSGETRFLSRASGLNSNSVQSAAVDQVGRLWLGTSAGITVFEPSRFGRRMPAVGARFATHENGLFISYEDHADYFRDDGMHEKLPRTYEFVPTRRGPLFGFWGKVRLGPREYLTPGNVIFAAIELPAGDILATTVGRIYHVDPVRSTSIRVDGVTLDLTSLACIDDTLWAITPDGILYRAPSLPPFRFTKVAVRPHATGAKVHALGRTLIVSSREGVRYGDDFREVENTRGITGQEIARNADGLWLVGQQDGVRRIGRLVARSETVVWETVDAKGLTGLSETHGLRGSGHLLTVCGDERILELDSEQFDFTRRLAPPRLAFTYRDARSGMETTFARPPEELDAGENNLAFSGTIPFDESGERPRFERRLLPTETAWVPTALGEMVRYPSLSARTYTLEVRTTHLGHSGPVAAHTFAVLPPWYATRAAAAGYVVMAALGFYGFFLLRTRQIRRRAAELERIVEERTHALAEASAAKTEFLASMSHEIRNPMNGVIGLVDLLREQPATPRQVETLRLLHHCADQLRNTVDDILDFSRIEAGRVMLEQTTFDLRDTLEAAAATIDPGGTKVTFLDRPPEGLTLTGDVGKLRQIFANYVSNALKYGVPPGARVSTLLKPTDTGLRLTIGVASSGPTIPKDTLDKFFESFTRGDDAISRNIHGTGLGLAICRKYAQAMGGEVGAVSANGETTFYLNVPFTRAGDTAPLAAPAAPPSALPAKALAIEDEDYNRIVLGSILVKMNYTVDWATTGEEALKLAQENGYDIILTDYRLPDTNGVELTKKILAFCPDPKPAVFAVTAYSTKERRDECLGAGMAGFISKPITLEKLRTTLAGWAEHNLAKISLEASRLPQPVIATAPPPAIIAAWSELVRTIPADTKRAAHLAHKLNNLCRAHDLIDAAEQLELLEGALERGDPHEIFVRACGEFLRG